MTERTPEEIRGLEERLAREMMGWSYQTFPGPQAHVKHWYSVSPCPNDPGHESFVGRCPPYYTDVNDALEVLEATGEDWTLRRTTLPLGYRPWVALRDGESPRENLEALTLPAAICEAVLAWLEADRD